MHNTSSSIYNYHVFLIMGIFFEIIGGLFLSMEAIGLKRFSSIYGFIHRLSKWSKKNILRMLALITPFFILLTLVLFSNSRILIGLIIPILFLIFLTSFLLDHPDYNEKWIIIKTKEGKIGPLGFLLIVFGNILQLISIIWQMSINQ